MYKVLGSVSSRAFRVLWMLEEIGEPYEFIKAGPHSDAVRAVNPSGKVPVLQVDGAALTDSAAILTYLADRHGKLTYPAGTLERARQDALTHCVLDELDAVLWTASRHSFVLPQERRVPAVTDSLKWEFTRNVNGLAERFKGPFAMGETMTIADIMLTHCLNWAYNAKFTIESEALLNYANTMRRRDAFRRVVALNEG
ncbi:MAG: glutathione S-transferase family protein [Jhaorihella sp.]